MVPTSNLKRYKSQNKKISKSLIRSVLFMNGGIYSEIPRFFLLNVSFAYLCSPPVDRVDNIDTYYS